MNTLINFNAPLKKINKSKIQLKRKIGSLKSTLSVVIIIKIFYINNLKNIETAYQLYWRKVKTVIIMTISKATLIILKTHGKGLTQ